MEGLKIVIQSLEDSKKEPLAIPELKNKIVHRGGEIQIAIMEDMTKEHKSGIDIIIKNPDGTYSAHLITENLFNGLISSYHGALKRFEDKKAKRN